MRVKLNWIELLTILPIIGILVGLLMPALLMPVGDFDLKHRYQPLAPQHVTVPPGIAGEYYLGDGLGTNQRLSILPDGRYSLVSSGCTGVHHRESGFVHETKGHCVLSPSDAVEPSIKRTFVLIGWGQRHYLIPLDEMREFRGAIIEGEEPRDDAHGNFYIRRPIAPAAGLPDSPPELANTLREGLLLGKVTEVSAVGLARVGRATVNLGAKEGLREGDVLTVQRHGPSYVRRLLVVSVADHSCVADKGLPDSSERPLEPGTPVVAVVAEEEGRPR
jgi:hypothetical protein